MAYLDRPVFEKERQAISAWVEGGPEAEKQARLAFVENERNEHRQSMREFREWQENVRQKKLEELKRRQARGEKVGYFDIQEDGSLRPTAQYYDTLSPDERKRWDERVEQAHRDAEEERRQVHGDGITAMGKTFWSSTFTKEIANEETPLDGDDEIDSTESEDGSNSSSAEEKQREVDEVILQEETPRETPTISDTPCESPSVELEEIVIDITKDTALDNTMEKPKTPTLPMEQFRQLSVATSNSPPPAPVEQREANVAPNWIPTSFPTVDGNLRTRSHPIEQFRELRVSNSNSPPPTPVERSSWDALQREATGVSPNWIPTSFPSMDDDVIEDDAIVHVLTREEILKQLRAGKK